MQEEKKDPYVEDVEKVNEGVENIEEKETLGEEKEVKDKEPEIEIKEEEISSAPPMAQSVIDEDNNANILKEADSLREKSEGRKIEYLLQLAQDKGKGIEFAIEVAKKTEDACLIDLLHDTLIKKGLYKNLE